MIRMLVVPCMVGLLIIPFRLTAQDRPTFGVNLGVLGTQQIGITYHLAPAVTLRPAITFGWWKNTLEGAPISSGPTYATWTDLGLALDLLFPTAGNEDLTTYLGVGGNAAHGWYSAGDGETRWGLNGIFGVRVSFLERLAAYGELFVRYVKDGGDYDRQRITVGTTALGVIVYFD